MPAEETPGEAEQSVSEFHASLRAKLDDAKSQLERAFAALPAVDPRGQYGELRDQWSSLRAEFDSTRGELTQAAAALESSRHVNDSVLFGARGRRRLDAEVGLASLLDEPALGVVRLHEDRPDVGAVGAADLAELVVDPANGGPEQLSAPAKQWTPSPGVRCSCRR